MLKTPRTLFQAAAFAAIALGQTALAPIAHAGLLNLTPSDGPAIVTDGIHDANKVKILRLPDGTLVLVYGQTQFVGALAYDLKAGATRSPYDVVVQYSTDEGATWSTPINIDNTAALSSQLGIIEGTGAPPLYPTGDPNEGYVNLAADPRAINYPGDSDKAQPFNVGNNIVITWDSKYCPTDNTTWPGESQRFVTYLSLNGITIPYSCMYVSRMQWNPQTQSFRVIGVGGEVYKTEQFSSAYRDSKNNTPIGQQPGFGIIWQEDPLGLQLGEAEGPGTGASGAKTTGGTDIWYTSLFTNNNATVDFMANSWAPATRMTGNQTNINELQGPERTSHGPGVYEGGQASAARPNIRLAGSQSIVAWEERKSTAGIDDGKYVRYHTFTPFTNTSAFPINGCIISLPQENGRRVRILTQTPSAGATNIVFIYKQGDFTQGGPSDVMMRRAVGGFDPANITPAIDVERCRAHVNNEGVDPDLDDPLTDIRNGTFHLPAVNFSGTQNYLDLPGTAPAATTGANAFEDTLAHRGYLRGDIVLVGYSHVPDQARFNFLDDAEPYNFYVHSSTDGGATWSPAYNFSQLTGASGLSVKEPRIVGTPGNGPGCVDPNNPVDPTDCQDPNVVFIGFGTQTNTTNLEQPVDVDVFMGVTIDAGASYSPYQAISAGNAILGDPDDITDLETQVKLRPDGLQAFGVWTSRPAMTDDVAFREMEVNADVIFSDSFESQLLSDEGSAKP